MSSRKRVVARVDSIDSKMARLLNEGPDALAERRRKAIEEEREKKKKKEDEDELKRKEKCTRIGEVFLELKVEDIRKQDQVNNKVRTRGEDMVSNFKEAAETVKAKLGKLADGTIFGNLAKLGSAFLGIDKNTFVTHSNRRVDAVEIRAGRRVQLSRKQLRLRAAAKLSSDDKKQLLGYLQHCWKAETHVTLATLLVWARENIDFPYGKSTLGYALRGMGLCFRLKNHNPIIEERKDLIKLREIYLRKMAGFRAKNAFFAFFDETWVFQGMTLRYGWQFTHTTMYQRARLLNPDAPVPGPKKGARRGKRGIVVAVLTENGVLKGSEQVWVSSGKLEDQPEDYHSEMNYELYEHYMKTRVIPELVRAAAEANRPPVLVIDNAPYHNRQLDKAPLKSARMNVIRQWLASKGILVGDVRKDALVKILEDYIESEGGRTVFNTYVFDEYAKSMGVTVVRLPPYHCFLNPIELLWSQLKQSVMASGTSSTPLAEVRQNTLDFLRAFTAESSQNLFNHIAEIEDDVRQKIKQRDERNSPSAPSTSTSRPDDAELDNDATDQYLQENEDSLDTALDAEDRAQATVEIRRVLEAEDEDGGTLFLYDNDGNLLPDPLSPYEWMNELAGF
ncbi:hypothetical protein CAEBREN_30910 [Caenorhabditis brenneri]|uniref:Tc1-like transposase DDE domain-containing protein n=1 Tax=Caenorhabditis brenneri TaxID=135651 RepID=G0P8H6_CAEBE|nr:hypothetical protein CAEBREN_30910 [Caenorhabditis brenneri]